MNKIVTVKHIIRDYEDQKEFIDTLRAADLRDTIDDIWEKIFRPAFKHGYPDQEIENLLTKLGDDGYELIDKLASIYLNILETNGVNNG